MYSESALKLYALKKAGIVKSNAAFWRDYENMSQKSDLDLCPYARELDANGINLLCAFDEDFPRIALLLRVSEKPYLFACRGDISLLKEINHNVAVVGVLNPSEEIVAREKRVVAELVEKGFTIVSGLARGCDTIAHRECLACGGKTVAFLPTTLSDIYPKENATLAEKIVEGGGLVITEYVTEPNTRQETIGRFIARDRLQAMFANRIILIASYLKGEGDSGSRHAMEKAKTYGRERFVMYHEEDIDDPQFGLNRQILQDGGIVLTSKTLEAFSS